MPSLWNNVQAAAGLYGYYHWLIIAFAVCVVALLVAIPHERLRVRNASILFALSIAALILAGAMRARGMDGANPFYKWLRWSALFIEGVAVINILSALIFEGLLRRARLAPSGILRDLLVALAYIVFGITLLSYSGVDLTGIVATSAVITAVIGFSLQDTLGNIMGGLALQMERTIRVGDWVLIDSLEGQVKEIRWRQTSIETREWNTVVIPNSVLMKGKVVILGRRANQPLQQRRIIRFNVDFRYPPTKVINAVEEMFSKEPIPNVACEPQPNCILMDYNESYGVYAARYWLTDLSAPDPTDSAVRVRIFAALSRNGIPLSIPAQSVFITQDSEARRSRKSNRELERRKESLSTVELFHGLTDDELTEVASKLQPAFFVKGELIARQGDEAHNFYVIRNGKAEVRLQVGGDGALSQPFASLRDGDFFGEMGLLTGEPRTATVVALTDCDCFKLHKSDLNAILKRRPEIAEDLSKILARRRMELDAFHLELDEEAKRLRLRQNQTDLLRRIRNFFKLEE